MATGYTESNTIRIDFTDDTWLDAFPNIYSWTNTSSIPWKVASTFMYEQQNTLRNGAISNYGSTEITLTFTLAEQGSITFPYTVSSERNYDKLFIIVDSVQQITVSGSVSWTNYTQQLEAGEHTVTFKYTKDGSGSSGSDAAGIGFIEIVGVIPNFNSYYLVHDKTTGTYYANVEGSLTEVPITTDPTLEDFINYGGSIPTSGLLDTLTNFELLKCAETTENTDKISGIKYSITGNVAPQLLKLTIPSSITEQYQTGFKSVSIDITKLDSTIVKVIFSPDEINWYAYDGTNWNLVSFIAEDVLLQGTDLAGLASINEEAFALLYTSNTLKSLHIAFVIQCTALDDWYISNIKIEFVSNK